MNDIIKVKICRKCCEEKPSEEFYKNFRMDSGLASYCIKCTNKVSSARAKTPEAKALAKIQSKKLYDEGYTRFGQGAICILRRSARVKKLPFDLTADFLKPWWLNQPETCFYCDIDINKYIEIREFILTYKGINSVVNKFKGYYRSKHLRKTKWMTVDRYDNTKGYTPDNIVKACWICNGFKSNIFNGDQMKIIGPMLMSNLISEIETAMGII